MKKKMSPLGIANMLAEVAHNKAQRGTANNYPNAEKNSDPDHVENNVASDETVANSRRSKTQVHAAKKAAPKPTDTPKPSKKKSSKPAKPELDAGDENY